jgi:hypothetical protein
MEHKMADKSIKSFLGEVVRLQDTKMDRNSGTCGHGNEPANSIQGGKYPDRPSYFQCLSVSLFIYVFTHQLNGQL